MRPSDRSSLNHRRGGERRHTSAYLANSRLNVLDLTFSLAAFPRAATFCVVKGPFRRITAICNLAASGDFDTHTRLPANLEILIHLQISPLHELCGNQACRLVVCVCNNRARPPEKKLRFQTVSA
jgi:hypothetical protein